MNIIHSVAEMANWSETVRQNKQTIGLVPTMGYLHQGHLSLVKKCRPLADHLVMSVFVNPAQFGPTEDLATYPRDFDRDCRMAESEGVDLVFNPGVPDIYPKGHETRVSLKNLPNHLCGLSRPVFFSGVATVVTKLFTIIRPHVAVFGQKDYQQLQVIRRLTADLNLGVKIVGSPIVREKDGLAMSSRNEYLSQEQRKGPALSLYKSLQTAQKQVAAGEKKAGKIIGAATEFIHSFKGTEIDYVAVCDPDTLDDVDTITGPVLMALAVKVGKTRLIDNMILQP